MLQFNRYDLLQLPVVCEQTKLGAARPFPGSPIGLGGTIVPAASMPRYLLTDRGDSATELAGDRAK
jgi:hypothetical protein